MSRPAASQRITRRIPVIGVLGGVASGKSEVTRLFERCGAGRLDADVAGHEVLRESAVIAALRKRFGESILDAAGRVDRTKVAKIVFADPDELRFLESITHPRIGMRLRKQAAELEAAGHPALVLDAAVMRKAGWDKYCDALIFVEAKRAVRELRAAARGWTSQDFAAREAAQESLDEKRQASQYAVENSGALAETQRQVRQIWSELTQGPFPSRGCLP